MRGLCEELGLPQLEPTVVYLDNSAVYNLSRDFSSSSKSRHIARRHFIVREYQHKRDVETRRVPTVDNWADLFTKQPNCILAFRLKSSLVPL